MKIIFDDQMIEDGRLGEVKIVQSATEGDFDVVAIDRDDTRVLKTFDTRAKADTWYNGFMDKLHAEEGIRTLDAR